MNQFWFLFLSFSPCFAKKSSYNKFPTEIEEYERRLESQQGFTAEVCKLLHGHENSQHPSIGMFRLRKVRKWQRDLLWEKLFWISAKIDRKNKCYCKQFLKDWLKVWITKKVASLLEWILTKISEYNGRKQIGYTLSFLKIVCLRISTGCIALLVSSLFWHFKWETWYWYKVYTEEMFQNF